jgi:hypothetical protein
MLSVAGGALMLLALGAGLPVSLLPELRHEMALENTYRPDLTVEVERASCRRYLFLVTSCSVNFSWVEGNARKTAESTFLVGLKSMGGVRVLPVRSPADPDTPTSAVALDNLGNRAWTLALVSGACLLLGLAMLMKLYGNRA